MWSDSLCPSRGGHPPGEHPFPEELQVVLGNTIESTLVLLPGLTFMLLDQWCSCRRKTGSACPEHQEWNWNCLEGPPTLSGTSEDELYSNSQLKLLAGIKYIPVWLLRNLKHRKLNYTSLSNLCCYCSVTQPCLTLCNPMDCSTPGFPVPHHLLEFAQIHVPWVSDAIQPSHLLSSPSPASVFPNIRVFSSKSALCIRWPKYWSFSFSMSVSLTRALGTRCSYGRCTGAPWQALCVQD